MGFLSGSNGSILFARSEEFSEDSEGVGPWVDTDTRVTNWTLSSSAQLLDTTTLGVYDKSSVYGLRTHTGTLRLLYYTEPGSVNIASPKTNSASWFINALIRARLEYDANFLPTNEIKEESIKVRLRLYLQKDGIAAINPDRTHDWIDLDANLTSVSFGSNVGELVAVDATFEATGRILISQV